MPASDGLQPPLNPAEREIVKSYGGWTQFLQCFALKPWNSEDAEEGLAILKAFTTKEDYDNDEREDASQNQSNK